MHTHIHTQCEPEYDRLSSEVHESAALHEKAMNRMEGNFRTQVCACVYVCACACACGCLCMDVYVQVRLWLWMEVWRYGRL